VSIGLGFYVGLGLKKPFLEKKISNKEGKKMQRK
jgi:hypothetical protein